MKSIKKKYTYLEKFYGSINAVFEKNKELKEEFDNKNDDYQKEIDIMGKIEKLFIKWFLKKSTFNHRFQVYY